MFRPLRRKARQISDEEAKQLLVKERRGVLAVNGDDGYPFALPINYYFDSAANKIYFHGAKEGYKVDALKRCDKVCFTDDGKQNTPLKEKNGLRLCKAWLLLAVVRSLMIKMKRLIKYASWRSNIIPVLKRLIELLLAHLKECCCMK